MIMIMLLMMMMMMMMKVYSHVRDQLWRDSSTTSHNWPSNFVNSIFLLQTVR